MRITVDTKIIVLTNQKGGCGKTTVTMQLAGALGRDGKKVLIVDADPQGAALRWASYADDQKPFPAALSGLSVVGPKVHQEVRKYLGQYDYIFIDCPPAVDSPIPKSALMVANVALVPVIPSPTDLWAAKSIQKLIEDMKDVYNTGLKAYIVPNMIAITNVQKAIIGPIKELGMEITNTVLGNRTAYRESAIVGGTVFDLKTESAITAQKEITRLKNELIKILKAQPATK